EDVTIGPAPIGGVALRGEGGLIRLRAVRITATTDRGLFVADGAQADAEDLVVEDTATPEGPADLETQGLGRGVEVSSAGTLSARRVALDRNRRQGALVSSPGSSLTLHDVVVADTLSRESDSRVGQGLLASDGARLEMRRAVLVRNRAAGLAVLNRTTDTDTRATAEDLVVRGTQQSASGVNPVAGVVSGGTGAFVSLNHALVEGNRDYGVVVESGDLELRDALVRDAVPGSVTTAMVGVLIAAGGRLEVERVLLEGRLDVGVWVTDEASEARAVDLVVREPRSRAGTPGTGVFARQGARLVLTRALISESIRGLDVRTEAAADVDDLVVRRSGAGATEGAVGVGAFENGRLGLDRALVSDSAGIGLAVGGAAVTLADLRILNTRGLAGDTSFGTGLSAFDEAALSVAGAVIEASREAGVRLESGASAELRDIAVRNTLGLAEGPSPARFGHGIIVNNGARATVEGALVENNRTYGILINAMGSDATITGVVVRDTLGDAATGRFGRGIQAQGGGAATVTSAIVSGSREVGIGAIDSRLSLRDVAVIGTRRSDCFPDCAGDLDFTPSNLHALGQLAQVDVERFRLLGGPETVCGVQVVGSAIVELSAGVVERHDIGVCLRVSPNYPLGRLVDGVAYIDSGVPPVESTDRDVPDPIGELPP
ncbi:MAG: right-handed parallel beta-helix repeat-containing protein, partial [Myxococcota bacterium]